MKNYFSAFPFKLGMMIAGLIIFVAFGYGGYRYYGLAVKLATAEKQLASTTEIFLRLQKENTDLADELSAEKERNNSFEGQINNITGTVNTLTKLKSLDPQLLQKYSKIYFLNEHYIPSNLATITPEYVYNNKRTECIHTGVWPHLEAMLTAASSSGAGLEIISAYRSFNEQTSLKSNYLMTYGSGANKFSADQGYSEHQLGTTVDLTTPTLGAKFSGFDKSNAYQWLTDNAYKYGFILSYPKSNTYYQYESWHWRFVGVALATKLHNDSKIFYLTSQREINTYLVNIFD